MHMPTQTHRGECFISAVLKTAFYLSCGAIKVGSRITRSQRQSSESCPKIKVEKGHHESSVSGWAVTCHLALCLSTESLIISTLTPPQESPVNNAWITGSGGENCSVITVSLQLVLAAPPRLMSLSKRIWSPNKMLTTIHETFDTLD